MHRHTSTRDDEDDEIKSSTNWYTASRERETKKHFTVNVVFLAYIHNQAQYERL